MTLSQKYGYDSLARIKNKNIFINNAMYGGTITYLKGATPDTITNLIDTIDYGDIMLKYEYDNLGNITNIYENDVLKVIYTYDNLNQLKTEKRNGITITYNYDLGGNITSKTNTSTSGSSTINYTYGNSNWKDLLSSYNGQNITYDAIGNPLTYGSGTTFTWQNGRRLATISKSGINAAYTYNVDGIRTKKVVNGVTTDYYLNGSNIVTQISGNDRLDFAYDENGNVYGFTYNNMTYAYIKNGQNDIIGIVDDCGDVVVTYKYDAWGNLVSCNGDTDYDIGSLNPFRYRGYYYDSESGLFYVGSRYYNPEWGRFINADGVLSDIGNIQGNNLFQYCQNNPVMLSDPDGHWPRLSTILAGAAMAMAIVAVVAIAVVVAPVLVGGAIIASTAMIVAESAIITSACLLAASVITYGVEEVVDSTINWIESKTSDTPEEVIPQDSGGSSDTKNEVEIPKNVERQAKKLSPEAKKGYDKAIEGLKDGNTQGLNDHALSGGRSGQRALDIKGTGKGRGAGRLIYETKNGTIRVIEIFTDHQY